MAIKNLQAGDNIVIKSYKHDGNIHRIWNESTILYSDAEQIIAGNHDTKVIESDGSTWRTKGSAIVYFSSKQWFNSVAYKVQEGLEYYCNLASPAVWRDHALTYVDYDLDIKVKADGTVELLDEDEFEIHQQKMKYPEPIIGLVEKGVKDLNEMIASKKGPFNSQEITYWSEHYQKYLNNK